MFLLKKFLVTLASIFSLAMIMSLNVFVAEEKIKDKCKQSVLAIKKDIKEQIEKGDIEQSVIDSYQKLIAQYEKLVK